MKKWEYTKIILAALLLACSGNEKDTADDTGMYPCLNEFCFSNDSQDTDTPTSGD